MRRLPILTLLLVFSLLAVSFRPKLQSLVIRGQLQVAGTQEPIPFAHIGVPGKNMGTISRRDGSYQIDLGQAKQSDSLIFSSLGYQRRTFLVADLKAGRFDVKMKERAILLEEVTISRKAKKPDIEKIGRYKPSKTTRGQSGIKDFGFGGEYGIRINKLAKPYHLKDINFHMRFNTADSILFRLNMYDVKEDLPHQSILNEDLFVTSYKGKKWISKDVEERKMVIDQDIVVTYEVIQVWYSASGQNNIFFTYGTAYPEGAMYLRRSSMDAWQTDESGAFPIALYVSGIIY